MMSIVKMFCDTLLSYGIYKQRCVKLHNENDEWIVDINLV